jgi:hypothetical protein
MNMVASMGQSTEENSRRFLNMKKYKDDSEIFHKNLKKYRMSMEKVVSIHQN